MKNWIVGGIIVGAVVIFAAGFITCFAVIKPGTAGTGVDITGSSPPPTSTSPQPTTNARGAIEKAFGEKAGLQNVEFVVDSPVEPTACRDDYPVENGRLIALPVTVETAAGADLSEYTGMWNENGFNAVRANGVTVPRVTSAAAYGCAESDKSIPDTLAPGSQYEDYVVLDIPDDATAIQFIPLQAGNGWEWALP